MVGAGGWAGAIGTRHQPRCDRAGFDARSEVAEQVESMGAEFLRIDVEDSGPSATGYAKRDGRGLQTAKAAEPARRAGLDVDIVITTALIPGKPHRGC